MTETSFKEWATRYHKRGSAYARDFLKDMDYDKSFPKSCNKNYIIVYLRKKNACNQAIEGFNEIWEEYLKHSNSCKLSKEQEQ